jgi:hypothetical protein
MANKKAMVAPPPSKPAPSKPAPSKPSQASPALTDDALARFLHELGNDRAYTVVAREKDHWDVMFEGENYLSIFTFKDGNPVLISGKFEVGN